VLYAILADVRVGFPVQTSTLVDELIVSNVTSEVELMETLVSGLVDAF
jgi:hypothetical protein